jgi:hypothetical protein
VDGAHNVCPSSHATRGTIDVAINLVYAGPVTDMACPCFYRAGYFRYYFATERGRAGYDAHRREFAKLI